MSCLGGDAGSAVFFESSGLGMPTAGSLDEAGVALACGAGSGVTGGGGVPPPHAAAAKTPASATRMGLHGRSNFVSCSIFMTPSKAHALRQHNDHPLSRNYQERIDRSNFARNCRQAIPR